MEESSSSDSGPVPTLQDSQIQIRGRTLTSPSEHDLRDPSESSPLLKVKRGSAARDPPPAEVEAAGGGQLSRYCNWKKLITTICLWLTYLIGSAAYSIIGPFFPSEV